MDEVGSPRAELPLLALLQRSVRRLAEEFVERLDAAGVDPITPAHMTVLAHVDEDAALSIAELARRAGVTRQTMQRAVALLVDEGLLTSSPGTGFPRSTVIALSDAGRRRRTVAMDVLAEVERALGDRLGHDALSQLRRTLTRTASS